eukprot:1229252-Amorphochlora_amoeboformis.AAC.1
MLYLTSRYLLYPFIPKDIRWEISQKFLSEALTIIAQNLARTQQAMFIVNFVSLDGRFQRHLNENERKTAHGGVFALVKMQWGEGIEEESFENEYKFWIA